MTNLGKYNEGQLVYERVAFPTDTETVQAALKKIGIDGIRYGEIFIADYDGDMPQLYEHLGEYESINELNHLACLLSELSQDELAVFEAVMDSGEYTGSVKDLINLSQNLDSYSFYSDVHTEEGMTVFLTTHYMEEAAAADNVLILEKGRICAEGTPDTLKSKYGKDTLKLRFPNLEEGMKQLRAIGYTAKQKADYVSLSIEDSHEALKIVNSLDDFLDFELIKGNMDDVFLTVTGHTEVPK